MGAREIIRPRFAWSFREATGYDLQGGSAYTLGITPYRAAGTVPPISTGGGDPRLPAMFGRCVLPECAGTAGDPAAGILVDLGLTTWMMDRMALGETACLAIVQQNDLDSVASDASTFNAPVIHNGHLSGLRTIRVRFASGDRLATNIGENAGASLATNSGYGYTVSDIATNSGNMTFWMVQFTPSDPALSEETHKHNLYLSVWTIDRGGKTVFGPITVSHYTIGAGAANARNATSDLRMSLGRTEDTSVAVGSQGGFCAMSAWSLPGGIVLTGNATDGTPTTCNDDEKYMLRGIWDDIAAMVGTERARIRYR